MPGDQCELLFNQLRHTEVENLQRAAPGHHQVLGFDVAMDDVRVVGRCQACRRLRHQLERPLDLDPAVAQHLAKCPALDVLHRDEIKTIRVTDVEDGDDVWMVQRGGRLCFLTEAALRDLAGLDVLTKHLQRNAAPEASILGEIDLAHAALAEHRENGVWADSRAGRKQHLR